MAERSVAAIPGGISAKKRARRADSNVRGSTWAKPSRAYQGRLNGTYRKVESITAEHSIRRA